MIPKKPAPDLIRGGNQFSDPLRRSDSEARKTMLKQKARARL
jgi:hypothetical protein